MAGVSYIGKPISLVSHSDIRYRGILHGIDPAASTISLANVMSMGTENRRPADSYIPPSDVPYEFIIFRASEVKDIAVDQVSPQAPRTRNVHDDPAVMTASAPPQQRAPTPPPTEAQRAVPATQPIVTQKVTSNISPPARQEPVSNAVAQPRERGLEARNTNANSAETGMENVQRAMGELRVSNNASGSQGNRRGRVPMSTIRAGEMNIPSTEFDFARSNARFDKVAADQPDGSDGENTNPSEDGEIQEAAKPKTPDVEKAYNPKASFFDSLSSGAARPNPGERGDVAPQVRGGGGRGRRGSSRREEERQKNVATFGEPGGGPGLMGPGAYVPGWGTGRRGQGRGGRRGGATNRPNA